MLALLALTLRVALADDPVPVEVAAPADAPLEAPAPQAQPDCPAPPPGDYEAALRLVDRLIAESDWVEARSLLAWLSQPEVPADVRARAAQRARALPPPSDATARLRLVPWNFAMGAWLLGPNMMWIRESSGNYNSSPLGIFSGAVLGAAGGTTAGLMYHRHAGLTHGQVSAIIHAQQLAMFNGAWLTTFSADGEYWEYGGWGLLGGAIAGSAAGYALAERPIDDGEMAAARAGAWLLPGYTLVTMLAVDDNGDFWQGEPSHDVAPFALAADLGTAAGWAAGHYAHLRRVDTQMITLGSVAGAGFGLGLAVATQDLVLWSGRGVAVSTGLFSLGGGALGYVLGSRMERPLPRVASTALLGGTPDHPVLGLPLPSFSPGRERWAASVQIVDMTF